MAEVSKPRPVPDGDGPVPGGEVVVPAALETEAAEAAPLVEKTQAPSISYWNLYRYADATDYAAIFFGIVGSAVNGVTFPLFAVVFGEMVDTFGNPEADFQAEVQQISLYFLYLAIATLIASFFEVAFFMWSGVRQTARMRQAYLEAALKQDITYYDVDMTSGDVLSGLNEDCSAVQNAISEKVGNVVHHLVTFFVAVGISIYRGWQLALVMLALTPLIAVAGFILAKVLTSGAEAMSAAYAKANTASSQAITNIRTVVSFQAEEKTYKKYAGMLDVPTALSIKMSTFQGMATGFVNLVVFVTYGIAFWYGAKLVRERTDYSGGVVMNVIFGAIIGGFSLGQAAPNFGAFATGRVAGARIMQVINRKPAIDTADEGLVLPDRLQGNIELRDVHFCYPARSDVVVFQGLNLTIRAGQNVALVGQSGSGKSTVIQLLERFYDPARGVVLVDGHDIRTLSLPWYRDQVGLVSQEPTLFATTIRENISMGRRDASEAEIEAAARAANAHRFISKLPCGYDTQVGERGVQLSGGQKQRIAISRALLKNPHILLLDEATSALDTVSERLVQNALEKLAVGRTTIVVAHRLSTIRGADKIAVVQNGDIVEEGTHDVLYADESSVYHSLVKLQQQSTAKQDEIAAGNDDGAVVVEELEELEQFDQLDEAVAVNGNGVDRKSSIRGSMSMRRSGALTSAHGPPGSKRAAAELGSKKNVADPAAKPAADELTAEEKQTKVGLFRLLGMNKGEWPYLFLGVTASAALGAVMPLFAVFLSSLIAVFFEPPETAKDRALRYSLYFVALGVGFFICATIQGRMFGVVGANLARRVRQLFFRACMYMEVAWYDRDENTSGALTARLSSDAPSVRGATGDVLGLVVQNIVTLIVGYIVAFINGWRMTLVITAVLPALGFSSWMQIRFFTGLDNKGDQLFAAANQTAHEGIQALRTVQSYGLEMSVARLYYALLAAPHKKSVRNALASGLAFGVGQFIMFAVYSLAFWFGGREVEAGRLTLEEMLKVFFSILLASMGISQAQIAFPDVAKGKHAVARVFRVVDRPSLIDASKPDGEVPAKPGPGAVELRDVTFAYPTRPANPVFVDFNLSVPAGCVTALVGESGSGKSTIVGLVERFYDVQKGQVLIDGVDVRQLQISWLRTLVGLVSQEPALFNGTILDNIKFGKHDATMDEVAAAVRVANAAEFIDRQPDKFGTLLGEGGGISLSGGQRQRIAIARAVLKDPRILLLDEATSALDAESERVVQDALDKLMVGRTSIVVAHRLTTIRNADKIAVVQAGVVLEQGTHDELMQRGKNGAYVALAQAQAGKH